MTDSIPRLGAFIGHCWLILASIPVAMWMAMTKRPRHPDWVNRADWRLAEAYGQI